MSIHWIIDCLHSLDFIGREAKLKLNRKPRNQTILGGILCIMMFCVFIPAALYFGQELPFRLLPKVIETTVSTEETDSIKISKTSLSFFLYLRDNKGQIYSIDKYLHAKLELISISKSPNMDIPEKTITTIDLVNCSENDILITSGHNSSFTSLDQWKCIKETNKEIYLKGNNHHSSHSYLQLKIEQCNPIESSCETNEDIDTRLKSTILVLKYYDTQYNQMKFQDFSELHIVEDQFAMNKFMDKQVYISFQITSFQTDIGYVFEDYRQKNYHNVKAIKELDFMSDNKTYKIQIWFAIDYSKSVNYRKYYKFQNWVAELGGIVKAITLVAAVINYFNDKSSYFELLINELFDVDDVIKYFQYSDLDSNNGSSRLRKKRDSIVLLNAKKEKDYFERGLINHLGTGEKQSSSLNNPHQYLKKNSNRKTMSFNNYTKGELEANAGSNIINNNINIHQCPKSNIDHESHPETSEIDSHEIYIDNLRKSQVIKDHFDKIKKSRFKLNMFEVFIFCLCRKKDSPKYNALIGGRELITERSDIVYILRKNLELDRFKSLILHDNQMLLLNSLTKFMLDPERVNLLNFHQCNYDKFIDAYDNLSLSSPSNLIDRKLTKWVETKFKYDNAILK